MSTSATNWSRYLASVCEDYAHWWEKYTLTDVTGKQRQAEASKGGGLLLNLMAETVPEKAEGELQTEKQTEKIERFTVLEGLRQYAKGHVLLQGAPGSGKSTAMARLLLEEAERAKDSQAPNRVVAGNARVAAVNATVVDQKALAIPVLVELRYYDKSLPRLIEDGLKRHDPSLDVSELEYWLRQGRLLLLLDGVNELPSKAAQKDLRHFRLRYEKTTAMVFTTRELGVGGDLDIATKLKMQPLSESQMQNFVQAYLRGQSKAMLTQLGNRLREFGETPLLLWMLCSVYANNRQQIPTNLGEFFRRFTQLYDNKIKQDVPDPNQSKLLWAELLQELAFQMIKRDLKKEMSVTIIARRDAEDIIRRFLQEAGEKGSLTQARLWLADLLKHHLIESGATDKIQFCHHLIQEYYAAEKLLRQLPEQSDEDLKWRYLNYLKWTEPLVLMAGLVREEGPALRLVRLALEVDYELGAKHAGAILEQWQPLAVKLVLNAVTSQSLRIRLLGTMHSAAAIPQLLNALQDKFSSYIRQSAVDALGDIRDTLATTSLLSALQDDNRDVRNSAVSVLSKTGNNSAIPELLNALQDDSWDFRRRVANALGQIGDTSAVPALVDSLRDNQAHVRNSAVRALGQIGDTSAVPALVNFLQYCNNPRSSRFVVDALVEIGDTSATSGLLYSLQNNYAYVRNSAVCALGQIGDVSAIPYIVSSLQDDSYDVRISAVRALGQIDDVSVVPHLVSSFRDDVGNLGYPATDALVERGDVLAISGLLSTLQDDDSMVRTKAADALGDIGDASAIPGLMSALQDDDEYVRHHYACALIRIGDVSTVTKLLNTLRSGNLYMCNRIADALVKIGNSSAVSILLDALFDDDWSVRYRAARSLCKVGNSSAVPGLLIAFQKSDRWEISNCVADALVKIGDTSAISGLLIALRNSNWVVRFRAAEALGEIGNLSAVPNLLKTLQDDSEYVCISVADALGKIGDTSAVPGLLTTLQDDNESIRASAASALGEIGDASAIPSLLTALQDDDEFVCSNAANALGKIDSSLALSGLIEAVENEFVDTLEVFKALKQAQGTLSFYRPFPSLLSRDREGSFSSFATINILILGANAKRSSCSRFDEEIRDIEEGLKRSRNQERFKISERWAVRWRDLRRAMLEENPQIVHFSARGNNEPGVFLEDNQANPLPVTVTALSNMFRLFAQRANIQCVVLNGCYEPVQAESIAQHIPYVIGLSQSVSDRTAIEFAVGFYDALGNGESVEFAFELGKIAMALTGIDDKEIPILLTKEASQD